MSRHSLGRWVAVLLLWAAPVAASNNLGKLTSEISELEQLSQTLAVRYSTHAGSPEQIAEHRLVDAQVLFNLKDYTRAAILLLDYVSNYQNTVGYPDALFYLAESLYQKKDYLGARRYFHKIATGVKGNHYQDALQRLIEIEMLGGDTSNVQAYLTALDELPVSQLKPSVPYVRGKYYYFKGQTDAAIEAFQRIAPTHEYYMHSQYFIGVSNVRKKNYAVAVQVFQTLLDQQPKGDAEEHIRALTTLALGRLLYQEGKIAEAIDHYQKISHKSDLFDTALYEIAWAYVKASEFTKALRALDLLALSHPNSPLMPEVRVLQANLLIRLKQWGRATRLFTDTRDQFEPAYAQMNEILTKHRNPNVFFDLLLSRSTGKLSVAVQVPEVAVHWVNEKPQVKRAVSLVKDIRDLESSLGETQRLIERLEHAVNSPAKIKIFPNFAAAKASSLQLENRLTIAELQIVTAERELVIGEATDAERQELDRLAAERGALERSIANLPTDLNSYQERQSREMSKMRFLRRDLSGLAILIDNLNAELVAAEKYFADSKSAKKTGPRESFAKETAELEALITGLETDVEELVRALDDAKDGAGVGGAQELAERHLKDDVRRILRREHDILASIRGRIGTGTGAQFDQHAALFRRADLVYRTIDTFNNKLDSGVDEKLRSVRSLISEQRQLVAEYARDATKYRHNSDDVAGGITHDGFRDVSKRFYEIMVRSDVGIIDVAWALKDSKSKEVSGLVRQRKMELKLLDDEFKPVLGKKSD